MADRNTKDKSMWAYCMLFCLSALLLNY